MEKLVFKFCNKMKRLFVFFISASLFTSCIYAQRNELFTTTYTFSAFAMSSVRMIEANTLNGSLTVTGNAGSEAVVEMYVSGNSLRSRRLTKSNVDIKQYLEENYTVEVKVSGEKLLVVAKPKTENIMNFSISFNITVPRQMNTNLEITNGSVQISNLSGSQKFQTVNGSLTVENVSGKIFGRTTNGNVTVTNSNDDIDIRTVNGSIISEDCNGKIILKTVNGKVNGQRVSRN